MPEVVSFLHMATCVLTEWLFPGALAASNIDTRGAFPMTVRGATAAANYADYSKMDIGDTCELFALLLSSNEDTGDSDSLVGLLSSVLATAAQLGTLYASKEMVAGIVASSNTTASADALDDEPTVRDVYVSLPSTFGWCWTEVFDGLAVDLVRALPATKLPKSIGTHIVILQSTRASVMENRRTYATRLGVSDRIALQWQKKRAFSIRMQTPKYDDHFNPDRRHNNRSSNNPDAAQAAKTVALHKREMKGAIREVRKDAAFLAGEKLKRQRGEDGEYGKKMKRVYGMLGDEQGEANKLERMAAKLKKRK